MPYTYIAFRLFPVYFCWFYSFNRMLVLLAVFYCHGRVINFFYYAHANTLNFSESLGNTMNFFRVFGLTKIPHFIFALYITLIFLFKKNYSCLFIYQKSFYSIRSSSWSLWVLTCTRSRSIVEIECDLSLFIYLFSKLCILNPKFTDAFIIDL